MKKVLTIAAATILMASVAHASGDHHKPHWGYTGHEGPANWGELDDAYHTCAVGKSQSPINIGQAPHAEAKGVKQHYGNTPLKIVNNGHTIQVNYGAGSTMDVDGKAYRLLQFHFHSPSEHTQNGSAYPMEAHLVHQAEDGSLAVVGVFLKEGKENPFISKIWKHLPHEVNHEVAVKEELNVADFLPAKKAYFHYSGSLTTPPCSEGVKWFVMDEQVEVSKDQVKQFLGLINENARPVQPLNGREVHHRM